MAPPPETFSKKRKPFWRSQITGLRRDGKAPARDYGAMVYRDGAMTFLTCDDGELWAETTAEGIADALLSGGDGWRWYVDLPERDLTALLGTDTGTFRALVALGASTKPYKTGRHTAGFVIDATLSNGQAGTVLVENLHVQSPCPIVPDAIDALRLTASRAWRLDAAIHRHFRMRMEMTPAGTAYKCWRRHMTPTERWVGEPTRTHWRPSRRFLPTARATYHGGLVLSKRRGPYKGPIRHYDVKSAYPWAMRQGVPIGRATHRCEADCAGTYEKDIPGWYRVDLVAPRPIATYFVKQLGEDARERDAQNTPGRYVYDVWLMSQELDVIEEFGGVIVAVREGWVFKSGIGKPFEDFVARCEDARRDPDPLVRNYVKLVQNSLYGRFGRKAEMDEVVIAPDPPGNDWRGRWMPHVAGDGSMDEYTWGRRTVDEDRPGAMPHWAAWITATVRCRLIRTIFALGPANVVYADTDSIVTTGELPTGDAYGDWQLVNTYSSFVAYAGKRWVGITTAGETVSRHGGLSFGSAGEAAIGLEALYPGVPRAGP